MKEIVRRFSQSTGLEDVETQAYTAEQGLQASVRVVVYSPVAQKVQLVASPEEKLPAEQVTGGSEIDGQ